MSKKEIVIIIILILVACVRFLFFIPEPPNYNNALGKEVVLEGQIVDAPDIRLKNQHLNIKLKDKDIVILIITGREKEVFYGDKVIVRGVLEEPENFITQSGKEFNYKRYLANKDIYFIIKNANIEILSSNNGNKIKLLLYKIRNAFLKKLIELFQYQKVI